MASPACACVSPLFIARIQVRRQLRHLARRDERADRDQAAVGRCQVWAQPQVPEQHLGRVLREPGRCRADQLLDLGDPGGLGRLVERQEFGRRGRKLARDESPPREDVLRDGDGRRGVAPARVEGEVGDDLGERSGPVSCRPAASDASTSDSARRIGGAGLRTRAPRDGADLKGRADLELPRAKDEVEPIASSRAMIDALRKADGQPRHTEYADRDHSVFAWAYTEPALIEWLFAQRLRPRS